MSLSPGTRLGHYDVVALIGEGGMGEVWQARDTKLDRDVALKVLPEAFTSDPDRLARFEREAKVLASLNHPNIGSIYGVEEADGVRALVLELVEGPTLADRIAQGAMPIEDALPIARQIAEALEAAHEAGVIHRDLKPANIKVREDGTVKVLDFGLAKALDPNPQGNPSQSPTLTAAAFETTVTPSETAALPQLQVWQRPVPLVLAGLALMLLGGLIVWSTIRPTPGLVARFDYDLPDGQSFFNTGRPLTAISPDGRELFYRSLGGMMVAQIETDPTFSARTPERLLTDSGWDTSGGGRQYDIAPDGDRFVFLKSAGDVGTSEAESFNGLIFIENWFEELKARVPIN